jgi:adhesin/invasin
MNVVTDANGDASVIWTLGTAAGIQSLEVATPITGVTGAQAIAGGNPDVAASLNKDSAGDNQSAVQGTNVAVVPFVTVHDQYGNPVPGVTVTFTPSGDGSVTNMSAISDAMGIASSGAWTLTSAPGPNTLGASATGLMAVTFNATATP